MTTALLRLNSMELLSKMDCTIFYLIAFLIVGDKKKMIASASKLWTANRFAETAIILYFHQPKKKRNACMSKETKKNVCSQKLKSVWLFIDCCDRNMTMINTSASFFFCRLSHSHSEHTTHNCRSHVVFFIEIKCFLLLFCFIRSLHFL